MRRCYGLSGRTSLENLSQLVSNSQKMKSLPLSFPRKKSSLLKNNLPTVNIFHFITLAYFRLIYFQLFWICSLYLTCLLRSIAIPKMEIDLLIKIWNSLDKNLNSCQILRKWSHCLFHFRERRARFSKTIFLQLIFSTLSPLLIFDWYIFSYSEFAACIWHAF